MNIKEKLLALDALFDQETKWTKEHFALDRQGGVVTSLDQNAVCWCITGGLQKVCSGDLPYEIIELLDNVLVKFGYLPSSHFAFISSWNDREDTTFVDIKRVIREAIRLCE